MSSVFCKKVSCKSVKERNVQKIWIRMRENPLDPMVRGELALPRIL